MASAGSDWSLDGRESLNQLAHLERVIERAAHLLPAQGPIRVFIHHNTLHAFEDLSFDEAVQKGAQLFGCHPYLPEDQYREYLTRGRIRVSDLEAVLRDDLGDRSDESILQFGTRRELRLAMLLYPFRSAPTAELRWFVARTDALKRFRDAAPPLIRETFIDETRHWVMRDLRRKKATSAKKRTSRAGQRNRAALSKLLRQFDESRIEQWNEATWEAFTLKALWRICRDGVQGVRDFAVRPPITARHRDLLLAATGQDSDLLVHPLLVRYCAAFLDHGLSHWPLPYRDQGFYRGFCSLYRARGGPPDRWLRPLAQELARLQDSKMGAMDSILESLHRLGVPENEWEAFVTASLLALRGWAGMIHQMETRGDRTAHPVPPGSLVEFLAIRLVLERLALAYVVKETPEFDGSLHDLRDIARGRIQKSDALSVDQRAFLLFHLAQIRGWLPGDLHRLTKAEWSTLVEEIESFSEIERRRILQAAFERRYRIMALDALSVHGRREPSRGSRPRFQVICCIDEREESLRRHLEELSPEVETYGAAGFFNVAMYYRGIADAHFVPLCPVAIRPEHWVVEDVAALHDEEHRRRAKVRRVLGTIRHQLHVSSRTFVTGALLAALGALASIPLVMRVLFPRLTARASRLAGRLVRAPAVTQLRLSHSQPALGAKQGQAGYTQEEMAEVVERVLRDIGMVASFSRFVIVVGHGSVSMNNPHESAHDCGACGGSVGGPNARALAQMANDTHVRNLLKQRGLEVPAETVFVGALHNTCDDDLSFYDLERLPESHQTEFEQIQSVMRQACERNAHERCRRFETVPLDLSFPAARRHVEGRSQDLAETRPEYGHATNAVCIIGRRQLTRGLFMDRRAFLVSYDPTQDDAEHTILSRILQAVLPVCAGINLEYYFSYVDPRGWGCDTKLPHNITSLLGVMDGAASDLRPGLPWQMVEIHEPVRLLVVVEATRQALLNVMDAQPSVGKLCRNRWIQTAILSPESAEIQTYRRGRFQAYQPETNRLPTAASSVDWYRGWRDHLGFAELGES